MLPTSDIEIDVDGRSGDQVRGSYLPRIKMKCADSETPYDWIIVMGGTNDLAWDQSPDIIYEGLRKLHCHCIIFPPSPPAGPQVAFSCSFEHFLAVYSENASIHRNH